MVRECGGVVRGLGTACSDKDYCSPVLCLESEAKNPFPFFSRILWHAREGLGCKHILCPCACSGRRERNNSAQLTFTNIVVYTRSRFMCDIAIGYPLVIFTTLHGRSCRLLPGFSYPISHSNSRYLHHNARTQQTLRKLKYILYLS